MRVIGGDPPGRASASNPSRGWPDRESDGGVLASRPVNSGEPRPLTSDALAKRARIEVIGANLQNTDYDQEPAEQALRKGEGYAIGRRRGPAAKSVEKPYAGNRTSGLISGEGKRGVAASRNPPRPSSTLPVTPVSQGFNLSKRVESDLRIRLHVRLQTNTSGLAEADRHTGSA